MIKIPTAYEAGFGQKTTQGVPVAVEPPQQGGALADTSAYGEAVNRGLKQTSNLLMEIGNDRNLEEARSRKEAADKIQKAEEAKRTSEAQLNWVNLQGDLAQGSKEIADRQDLSSEEKFKAFDDHLTSIKSDYEDTYSPDERLTYDPHFASVQIKAREEFANSLEAQAQDESKANVINGLAALEKQAGSGILDRAQAKEQAKTFVDSLRLPEAFKAAQVHSFAQNIDTNELDKRLNITGRDGFHAGLDGVLHDLQAKDESGAHAEYTDLDPKTREAYIHKVQSIKAEESRARVSLFDNWAKDALKQYEEVKLSGLPVDPKQEQGLAAAFKGTEHEKRFNEIKTKGESYEYVQQKLTDDPLKYGAARLGISLPPLSVMDMEDPNRFKQIMAQRVQAGRMVQAATGLDYTPVIMAGEEKAFAAIFKRDPEGAGMSFLEGMANAHGPAVVDGIARQMVQTDPQTAMAAGYVAQGDPQTAKAVVKGQRLMESKLLKMPPEEDMRAAFDKAVGVEANIMPVVGGASYDAYRAVYAVLASKQGLHDGVFDRRTAEQAFAAAVGMVIQHNGSRTLLSKDITEDQFINGTKHIDAEMVKRAGNGGVFGLSNNNEAAKLIREYGQFYQARPGVYRVMSGGILFRTQDGSKPLEFMTDDLRRMGARVPVSKPAPGAFLKHDIKGMR